MDTKKESVAVRAAKALLNRAVCHAFHRTKITGQEAPVIRATSGTGPKRDEDYSPRASASRGKNGESSRADLKSLRRILVSTLQAILSGDGQSEQAFLWPVNFTSLWKALNDTKLDVHRRIMRHPTAQRPVVALEPVSGDEIAFAFPESIRCRA